jgi:hypothetical protein
MSGPSSVQRAGMRARAHYLFGHERVHKHNTCSRFTASSSSCMPNPCTPLRAKQVTLDAMGHIAAPLYQIRPQGGMKKWLTRGYRVRHAEDSAVRGRPITSPPA